MYAYGQGGSTAHVPSHYASPPPPMSYHMSTPSPSSVAPSLHHHQLAGIGSVGGGGTGQPTSMSPLSVTSGGQSAAAAAAASIGMSNMHDPHLQLQHHMPLNHHHHPGSNLHHHNIDPQLTELTPHTKRRR